MFYESKDNLLVDLLIKGEHRFFPSEEVSKHAHLNEKTYLDMYTRSLQDGEAFWLEQAQLLDWFKAPSVGLEYEWNSEKRIVQHTWFKDGKLNVSYNCLDRYLHTPRENKIAFIWQGDEPGEVKTITYKELHHQVCKCANVLKSLGISKGDRVCIYLGMVIELPVMMLACARIGAIHSVVFGGFSAEALRSRINDAACKLLITANVSKTRRKIYSIKSDCR